MNPLRTTVFASCVILAALTPNVTLAGSTAASSGGYVDEAVFRALMDDDQDIVEINLDGTVTYTPDADYNGADSFTYTVSDGTEDSGVATVERARARARALGMKYFDHKAEQLLAGSAI